MRSTLCLCVSTCLLNLLLLSGCSAEDAGVGQQAKPVAKLSSATVEAEKPEASSAAKLDAPKKATFAPLGSPDKAKSVKADTEKKPVVAKLGSPGKPKFALKRTGFGPGAGANAPDRAAEVKRLIAAYENIAIRYADMMVLATTPEQEEAAAKHCPSAKALRSIATLLAHIVAVDATDEPAMEALSFLVKYVGVPEIDAVFAGEFSDGTQVDPMAMLLEHHANNPNMVGTLRRLPRSSSADAFLIALFQKTLNPDVRWLSGAQLIASLRRNGRPEEEMEKVVVAMSEDRYLEGVKVGRSNARDWAVNKLREIRTLGIGNVLPEVSGEKLEGGIGNVSDYRGKVLLLDVWTTWCGPCRAMTPHHIELVERLKDKPFAMLSVSCDRDKATLEEFLANNSMPWDHWWVEAESEFKKTLNIASFPTIYVLDAEGVIRYKNIKDEELDQAIDTLLSESESSAALSKN